MEGSGAEDGSLAYDLCVARDDCASFVVLETWRDDAAIEALTSAAQYTTLVPRMVDLCAEPASVVQYTEA